MPAFPKILTFQEFEQLADKPGKQELFEGRLIELPPAKERHSLVAHRLFRLLDRHMETASPHLSVRMETGYKLGQQTYFRPDAINRWVIIWKARPCWPWKSFNALTGRRTCNASSTYILSMEPMKYG